MWQCGPDGTVAKGLADQGQVEVAGDERRAQGVLQNMGMRLLHRQSRRFRHLLEAAKELRAIESPSFLRAEHVIRAVCRALAEPGADGCRFIEQWLAAVLVERLYGVERALQSADRNRAGLEIDVS